MKHLKRFNEHVSNHIDEFYGKYKDLLDFSEEDFDQGEEPSHIDLYDSLGELCLKYHLTREDAQFVIDNYDCSFDVDKLLQSTIDYWID